MCHRYKRDSATTTSHRTKLDVPNITASQRPIPPDRARLRLPAGRALGRAARQKIPAFTPGKERKNHRTRRGTKWRGTATEIQEANGIRPQEGPSDCPAEDSGPRGRLMSNRDRAPTGEKGGDACSLVVTERKQMTRRKASRDAERIRAETSTTSEARLVEFIQDIWRSDNVNQARSKENTIILKNHYRAMSILRNNIYSLIPSIANKRTQKYLLNNATNTQ